MDKKAALKELNYQYKLLQFENEVLLDKYTDYLEAMSLGTDNEFPKVIVEGSKNYATKQLAFLNNRKNILEYNLKNIDDELKRV